LALPLKKKLHGEREEGKPFVDYCGCRIEEGDHAEKLSPRESTEDTNPVISLLYIVSF
jgi:hypothetical protein